MYIFDTNVFRSLKEFTPTTFPTIWDKIHELTDDGMLLSVREVLRELDNQSASQHVNDWVSSHQHIFLIPSKDEFSCVADLLKNEQVRNLVKKQNILRGQPAADPFIIASGIIKDATVVTQESFKPGAARIPTICQEFDVECINLNGFFEREELRY